MIRWLQLLVAVLAAGAWSCSGLGAAEPSAEGTRRMAELLARLAREADPARHPFLNGRRADLLADRITNLLARPDPSVAVLVNLRGQLGMERLQAGQIPEAIAALEGALVLHRSREGAHFQGNRDETTLRTWLALAWLRLGEQENCIRGHAAHSCLIPISPSGIHALPRGSRNAIRLLREQLTSRPDDLRARWLLNLAAMTVGDHPARVPPEFLIPAEAFASEHDPGRFPDVAGELGLDIPDLSGGCILDDFDGDGDLDLAASSLSLSHPLRYVENGGDGTFADRTEAAGLAGITGGLNLIQADYDNDGLPDILVLRGGWLGPEGRQPKS
ncbi:MAG: VCBS repeat-containing protein, partial [Verrucomicrobia bacterium]|nr:VCBS repeat-containing protein [Verrucomicrobiota bacterium]